MDISASCYSLQVDENARAANLNNEKGGEFATIIVSCRSLSHYESKTWKALLPQIIATAISASFHIMVGLALAYSAIMIPQLEDPDSEIHATQSQSSWIASIIVVVVPIGAILGGFIMDAIGRLNTIKISTLPAIIGWSLIGSATNIEMILLGRVFTGLACAWCTSPAIVYITEIASPQIRGSLISTAPAYASLGMVIAYFKGWMLNWRTVAWTCNAYSILPAILILFIPESPAWLVSRGRIDQARQALEWINRNQPQPVEKQESLAELQLNVLIKEQAQKDAAATGNKAMRKLHAFFEPTGIKPMLIFTGLCVFQQFSGIYITLFFSVTFFEEMNAKVNPYFASVLIGVVRLFMSMVNTYLLKCYHRRPLVMVSAIGMSACMLVSGLFTLLIKEEKTTLTWIPVVFLLLYVLTSMIGMLPIPWTMTAELFPLEIRGLAHSIAYGIANMIMFGALQAYRPLNNWLNSYGTQWFFAGVSLLAVVYTYVFLPETHGKKLSEIQEYFKHNVVYLGQKKPTTIVKNRRDGAGGGGGDAVKLEEGEPDQKDSLIAAAN